MAANSRFAVATHILTGLGMLKSTEVMSSERLAQSVNTHPVVIRRILLDLKKAKLIHTQPGKTGGTRLLRAPDKISLFDIYNAVEDGHIFALNTNSENPQCPLSCKMKSLLEPVFRKAEKALSTELKRTHLADLIGELR